MPLVRTEVVMNAAITKNVGIGAFNVIHLETAEALVAAGEHAGGALILQISENCVAYHRGLEPIALAVLAMARTARVPVAVHLDHAEDERLVREAVEMGFGSVMFDGAKLDYRDNVEATIRIVEYAHERGVYVEAELGEIGGKDGAHVSGVRTDPLQAAGFVEATGVDALAVAVGSSHAMTERVASIDFDLVRSLKAALPVPLVLHGSSGVSDDQIVAAIRAGMTKINVSTHLNGYFTTAIRQYLTENSAVVDSRKYVGVARQSLAEEAARLIALFSGSHKQEEA